MATNASIRAAVMKKLDITSRQGLSARVGRIKAAVPMSAEDGLYVLAHQNGIRLDKELDTVTLDRIGQLVGRVDAAGGGGGRGGWSAAPSAPPKVRATVKRDAVIRFSAGKLERVPGMTSTHVADASRMANVYPLLYVFENSARDVIDRVLTAALGKDWWDQVATTKLKNTVADRKEKEGDEAWHSKRGGTPLSYIDLSQLPAIVRDPKVWPHLRGIFTNRQTWFEGLVDDLSVSRNVVAHMNPLTVDDIKQLEAAMRKWTKQITANESRIP